MKWLIKIVLFFRTVSVCPRDENGNECKYTKACFKTHYRVIK